jgi:hypothetical protein
MSTHPNTMNKTFRELGSNNAIAMVSFVLTGNWSGLGSAYPIPGRYQDLCGKKVKIYRNYNYTMAQEDASATRELMTTPTKQIGREVYTKYTPIKNPANFGGELVSPPDGKDWFIWDTCEDCAGGMKIKTSLSGVQAVDPNACANQRANKPVLDPLPLNSPYKGAQVTDGGITNIFFVVEDEQVMPFTTEAPRLEVPMVSRTALKKDYGPIGFPSRGH